MYLSTVFTSSASLIKKGRLCTCILTVFWHEEPSSLAHARTVKALTMWWCVLAGAVLLSSQGKLEYFARYYRLTRGIMTAVV